jgi:hypothetical protein
MGLINSAVVVASEEAAAHSMTPPWVFGVTAFGFLFVALIVTLMLKVGD